MKSVFLFNIIALISIKFGKAPVPNPAKCNENITQCIQALAPCSYSILEEAQKMGVFTYAFTSADIPWYVKCVKGRIYDVSEDGKTAKAEVTTYYKLFWLKTVDNYKHEVKGCGQIEETDLLGNKFLISLFPVPGCFCYSRCSEFESDGDPFVAGAIKLGTDTQPESKNCLKKCKEFIKQCQVEAKQIPITPCSSN